MFSFTPLFGPQVLQRNFRGLVEAVYIVQPTKFLQKHSTAVSLRREAKDVDFEVRRQGH